MGCAPPNTSTNTPHQTNISKRSSSNFDYDPSSVEGQSKRSRSEKSSTSYMQNFDYEPNDHQQSQNYFALYQQSNIKQTSEHIQKESMGSHRSSYQRELLENNSLYSIIVVKDEANTHNNTYCKFYRYLNSNSEISENNSFSQSSSSRSLQQLVQPRLSKPALGETIAQVHIDDDLDEMDTQMQPKKSLLTITEKRSEVSSDSSIDLEESSVKIIASGKVIASNPQSYSNQFTNKISPPHSPSKHQEASFQNTTPETQATITQQPCVSTITLKSHNLRVRLTLDKLPPFKRIPALERPELEYTVISNGITTYYGQKCEKGLKCGFGTALFSDGAFYEGYWLNNKAHHQGRIVHADGDVYDGEWVNGMAEGQGVYFSKGKERFRGKFLRDLPVSNF